MANCCFYPIGKERFGIYFGDLDRLKAHLVFQGLFNVQDWGFIKWLHSEENDLFYFMVGCSLALDKNLERENIASAVKEKLRVVTHQKLGLEDALKEAGMSSGELPNGEGITSNIAYITRKRYMAAQAKEGRGWASPLRIYQTRGTDIAAVRVGLMLLDEYSEYHLES